MGRGGVPASHFVPGDRGGLRTLGAQLQRELIDDGIRLTIVRAGQMKHRLNLTAPGVPQCRATTEIVRSLPFRPRGVHLGVVRFHGRVAD